MARFSTREVGAVRWLGAAGAVVPLLALVFVLVTLLIEAVPAIKVNGLHFSPLPTGIRATPTATPPSPAGCSTPSAPTTGRCR